MPEVPPITGVAEIVLNVNDIPVMRKFYSEVLGFELFSESRHETDGMAEPGEPTISFLKISSLAPPFGDHHPQLLALVDYRRHFAAKSKFKGHDISQSSLNHLAFEIPSDSYQAHFDRLSELNLEPMPIEFDSMKAKAIFFRDPEGNTLELICHNVS